MDSYRVFELKNKNYLFSGGSCALWELDEIAWDIVKHLKEKEGATNRGEILSRLAEKHPREKLEEALNELGKLGVMTPPKPLEEEKKTSVWLSLPVQVGTIVLSLTRGCNLRCTYCYAGGGTYGKPDGFMSTETALQAIDFLINNSGDRDRLNLVFFGGEPLLNVEVMKTTVNYARKEAKRVGKRIDFALTSNGTLLSADIIAFIAENDISLGISIDGPREINDRNRVFPNGQGSYKGVHDAVLRLMDSRATHRLGARVTLTRGNVEIKKILKHLMDWGFYEVGFAPVTAPLSSKHSLTTAELKKVLDEFEELAQIYIQAAKRREYLGFSNLTQLLAMLHKGEDKPLPCGAGIGLFTVSIEGDIYPCHRLLETEYKLGDVKSGLDGAKRDIFLKKALLEKGRGCGGCWVKNLCSGGCYHEAYVRFGNCFQPNKHYCNWVKQFTELGLRTYLELALEAPEFLNTAILGEKSNTSLSVGVRKPRLSRYAGRMTSYTDSRLDPR